MGVGIVAHAGRMPRPGEQGVRLERHAAPDAAARLGLRPPTRCGHRVGMRTSLLASTRCGALRRRSACVVRRVGGSVEDRLRLDLHPPARIEQASDKDHRARRTDLAEDLPVDAPDRLPIVSVDEVRARSDDVSRTRTESSVSAARMIARHRRAWFAGSGSHDPSGQTGAVPLTRTRCPTRTARLNPTCGSNGDPDETRRRSMTASVTGNQPRIAHHGPVGRLDGPQAAAGPQHRTPPW
jgi:hypothetical protein